MYDFLDQSTRLLEQAGHLGEIDANVLELLKAPARVVRFRIPLKMDDGSLQCFDACRVRYNDALGPTRDGTRISPDFNADEASALALIMTIKHAAGRIPAGGGKGGIAADPRRLSRRELEALCRGYVRHLRSGGSGYDVPGADIGTDLQCMAWMLDEHESLQGRHEPAAVNDKPAILGGTVGGYEATGEGVFDVCREAAGDAGLDLAGAAIAIQGFGQVGSVAAARFRAEGARVVAVSDVRGGVYSKDGIDVEALLAHRASAGTVCGLAGTADISNEELLACDCDVLVPAAVQGVITADNAGGVQARMVVEAANAPTTLEAESMLIDAGVTVVPDVLANAGSVHLCQMERTQGLYDHYWDVEDVHGLRHTRMIASYRAAMNAAAVHGGVSARLGAWINALKRIEEAVKARGWC
jgi:glutamate dehydrogenase